MWSAIRSRRYQLIGPCGERSGYSIPTIIGACRERRLLNDDDPQFSLRAVFRPNRFTFIFGPKAALQNGADGFVLDMKSGIVLGLTDAAHFRHHFLNIFIW